MGVIRNGRSATIREFVKAHPACQWGDIIAGLSALGGFREIGREITRMVRDGRLVAERDGQRLHYLPGREREPRKSSTPKPSHVMRTLPACTKRSPPRHARAVPKLPPCQTVEEFLANGGKVERLPTHWEAPTRYPAPAMGYRATYSR